MAELNGGVNFGRESRDDSGALYGPLDSRRYRISLGFNKGC